MYKILCLGNATWDRIYSVDEIPSQATKYFSSNYLEVGGGVAATAAVAASKLGASVEFIGRIGQDIVGELVEKDLNDWNVHTSHLKTFPDHTTSNAVVHVDIHGERQITVHRDPNLPRDANWITAQLLENVDCVLCDCTWNEGAEKLLTLARELNIPSVIDADLGGESLAKLIALTDHVAFSYPALCSLSGQSDLEESLRIAQTYTNGIVYVTQGDKGCYWLDQGILHHIPAYKVKAIDTTGAGDVFHGALSFAIAQGNKGAEAIRFANAVAALKCTVIGGRAGIPTIEQTIKFINSQNI
ncbi:PfkB family carbohydrate kinase [Vibrio sp. MA40-2]|uniref:PfkB family carbohydrate kinase n=1 Tax=Vibrio sp. MA40-2 TaxID=3391828 RepID=UPI0039A41509